MMMTMIKLDKNLISELLDKAAASERLRMNYDLRTSAGDNSQRMLNALLPGTVVPIHRHPISNENVILLCGKLVEIIYEDPLLSSLKGDDSSVCTHLVEKERIMLDAANDNFGCVVPAGAWHTVEVLEPSVIYEAKDGKYGEDGSESLDEYKEKKAKDPSQTSFSNCLGDLKKNIEYLIGMERQSGSMDAISPLYVARMLNVPVDEVERCMREMVTLYKFR